MNKGDHSRMEGLTHKELLPVVTTPSGSSPCSVEPSLLPQERQKENVEEKTESGIRLELLQKRSQRPPLLSLKSNVSMRTQADLKQSLPTLTHSDPSGQELPVSTDEDGTKLEICVTSDINMAEISKVEQDNHEKVSNSAFLTTAMSQRGDCEAYMDLDLDRSGTERLAPPTAQSSYLNVVSNSVNQGTVDAMEQLHSGTEHLVGQDGFTTAVQVGTDEQPQMQVMELEESILAEGCCATGVPICPPRSEFSDKINSCKSLAEILVVGQSFRMDKDESSVVCEPCESRFGRRWGKISYNETDADALWLLKQKMVRHVCDTNCHRQVCGGELSNETNRNDDRDEEAGNIVGHLAYNCVKLGTGYAKFEDLLQTYAITGGKIGDINHSQKTAAALNKNFYKVWRDHMQSEFSKTLKSTGKPPYFSVVADKCTPHNDSLHVVGVIMPYKGKLEAYFIGLVNNKSAEGKTLAKEIYTVLRGYFSEEEIRTRMVGASWDGQYVKNSVAKHLLKLTGHRETEFISCTWDASHALELAAKDARRLEQGSKEFIPFIKNTYGPINDIRKKHARGKSWRKLKKLAKKTSKKRLDQLQSYEESADLYLTTPLVYRPFCETRFATYTGEAINSFRRNFHLHYRLLEKTADPALVKIANSEFVMRMNGLYDFYSEVGRLSRIMQRPDLFTWNVEEAVDEAASRLQRMKKELQGKESPQMSKHFAQAAMELTEKSTYKRCPIVGGKLLFLQQEEGQEAKVKFCHKSEIRAAANELCCHIDKFVNRLQQRMQDNRPSVLDWTNNVFSTAQIKSRGGDTSPRYLKKLYDASVRSGILAEGLKYENFEEEYRQFTDHVRIKLQKIRSPEKQRNLTDDQIVYTKLLKRPSDYQNVMNLLSSSVARTYCESVTEGMGSTVDAKLKGRERLSDGTLFQESFLAWNGPSVGSKANYIVTEGLRRHFNGRPWHFFRKTNQKYINFYKTSKVIDRKESSHDRLDNPSLSDSDPESD